MVSPFSSVNGNNEEEGLGVAYTMTAILITMLAILAGTISIQTPSSSSASSPPSILSFTPLLPCPKRQPSKRAYEIYALCYTPIWILAFACIVAFQLYESFTATTYNIVCIGLSLPYLLQPILAPSVFQSPDGNRHWTRRYSTKANLWIAIYSFIGNYWYTHYFYSVLKAKYTMPAHRLNDVPIALYFATHFYFSTYHVFSNGLLRRVVTSYEAGWKRSVLFVFTILAFSYFTAFMETLTISAFPYYSFEDRDKAYTVGSAFYGIYFLISFPMFFFFDEDVDVVERQAEAKAGGGDKNGRAVTLWDTAVSSCGAGMMILCLLDFVRLNLRVPLTIGHLEQ